MKVQSVRGHFYTICGLIPVIEGAKALPVEQSTDGFDINRFDTFVYVIDLKIIFSRYHKLVRDKHGEKRASRLADYLHGRPKGSFLWAERREIETDLRALCRKVRKGGYDVVPF